MRTMRPPSCGLEKCKIHRHKESVSTELLSRMFMDWRFWEVRFDEGEIVELMQLHDRIRRNG